MLVKSWSSLVGLFVFGGDSFKLIPYITMLNFWSGDIRFVNSDAVVWGSTAGCKAVAVSVVLLSLFVAGLSGVTCN